MIRWFIKKVVFKVAAVIGLFYFLLFITAWL